VTDQPETIRTNSPRVVCDGSGEVAPALGHPRVWLEIDERGYVDCGYCDRRFLLVGSAADHGTDDNSHDAKGALDR
jgi:NADH dehydrogenase (ubiquinone) Fe-S protein 6